MAFYKNDWLKEQTDPISTKSATHNSIPVSDSPSSDALTNISIGIYEYFRIYI